MSAIETANHIVELYAADILDEAKRIEGEIKCSNSHNDKGQTKTKYLIFENPLFFCFD